jgi:uncharacterized protein (DUF1684 family)
MSLPDWQQTIERVRETKDAFFAQNWQSPISFQDRSRFEGLQYYPPNPSYRFELELQYPEQHVVRIAYTKGNEQDILRWGEFRFKIDGKELSLQAYKHSREEEMLFVPFKDATSGKETCGAGRYLDLEPDGDRTQEGRWILDFNQAYNPWCAYNDDYTCPFVPAENWLEVPIYAGEKYYHLPKKV